MERFEEFDKFYKEYAVYKDALEVIQKEGDENIRSGKIEEMINKIVNDFGIGDDIKEYLQNSKEAVIQSVNYFGVKSKEKANVKAEGGLEATLKGIDKEDLKTIGVGLVDKMYKLKDAYTGDNADAHTEITKLYKEIGEMIETIQKKDAKKINEVSTKSFEEEYSRPEQGETLEYIKFLMGLGELPMIRYDNIFKDKQKTYEQKLDPNIYSFLANNLAGKDFVNFYQNFKMNKENPNGRAN